MKLISYIKGSFKKFKKDALSKFFYEILKLLVISPIITFIISFTLYFIPKTKKWITYEFFIPVWLLITLIITSSSISIIVLSIKFIRKYNSLKSENETDDLTGLKNYKALKNDLTKLESERTLKNEPISLILIDVDNFKDFNNKNSYQISDKILAKLGGLLKRDSRVTDETYRYFMRGDEFLIIATQTTIANAKTAANRKRNLIKETTFTIDEGEFNLTVCCGVIEFKKDESKDIALSRLDRALKIAKNKLNKNSTEVLV